MQNAFKIGPSVERAGLISRYRRKFGDPVWRPLQIYSTDPSDSQLDGAQVVVNVAYEELAPGPVGALFEVVGYDSQRHTSQLPLDLNDPRLLCTQGLAPNPGAQFQMQMTYAVAMATYQAFSKALGRELHWGFNAPRLRLFPFDSEMINAYYCRESQSIRFGWYQSDDRRQQIADDAPDPSNLRIRNLCKSKVFTSLSHDIIVHEVSHAILDGLRPHFLMPYHRDTLALHEGFADLVAIFQHFSHRKLLEIAISRSRGKVSESHLLTDIARQFGQTQKDTRAALRTAVDAYECNEHGLCSIKLTYGRGLEIHKLGSVLVSAVFEAFTKVFDRKAKRYIDIATAGTGILPQGAISPALTEVLAKEAAELATQFMSICIRALDYCPPMAVTFGDYLRAMITADNDLVPSDPYGYREALVDAFVLRGIPIEGIENFSQEAILWPVRHVEVDPRLLPIIKFSTNEFKDGSTEPGQHYRTRANRLAEYLFRDGALKRLGLQATCGNHHLFREVGTPCLDSVRVSRRVGPDGQLETDLIVEVTQQIETELDGRPFPVMHGATIIINAFGEVRFVIQKDARVQARQLQADFAAGNFDVSEFWQVSADAWQARPNLLAQLHDCG